MTPSTIASFARTAELFHALSDEARVEIVSILLAGEHCVCDLMTHVGAAQSRLSYHLKVLKDAGVVTDRREGRWSYYAVNGDVMKELEALASALRPRGKRSLMPNCCG